MNQPPPTEKQTGKRIVSKGAYMRKMGNKVGTSAFGLLLLFFCALSILLALVFLSFGMQNPIGTDFSWVLIFLEVLLVGGALYLGYLGQRTITEAKRIDPGVPLTRANTADLPAPESLVRASAEPMQEPQAVLLRAATETQERHEEQLVRPVE